MGFKCVICSVDFIQRDPNEVVSQHIQKERKKQVHTFCNVIGIEDLEIEDRKGWNPFCSGCETTVSYLTHLVTLKTDLDQEVIELQKKICQKVKQLEETILSIDGAVCAVKTKVFGSTDLIELPKTVGHVKVENAEFTEVGGDAAKDFDGVVVKSSSMNKEEQPSGSCSTEEVPSKKFKYPSLNTLRYLEIAANAGVDIKPLTISLIPCSSNSDAKTRRQDKQNKIISVNLKKQGAHLKEIQKIISKHKADTLVENHSNQNDQDSASFGVLEGKTTVDGANNLSLLTNSSTEVKTETKTTKRGRGRPRKDPSKLRPSTLKSYRSRKKTTSKADSMSSKETFEPPLTSTHNTDDGSSFLQNVSLSETVPKRSRGRPRTKPIVIKIPGKRGRPRKNPEERVILLKNLKRKIKNRNGMLKDPKQNGCKLFEDKPEYSIKNSYSLANDENSNVVTTMTWNAQNIHDTCLGENTTEFQSNGTDVGVWTKNAENESATIDEFVEFENTVMMGSCQDGEYEQMSQIPSFDTLQPPATVGVEAPVFGFSTPLGTILYDIDGMSDEDVDYVEQIDPLATIENGISCSNTVSNINLTGIQTIELQPSQLKIGMINMIPINTILEVKEEFDD